MADIAAKLMDAIDAGDFERACPLVFEYGISVRNQLSAASTLAERQDIFHRALENLNRHLYLTRALRSHISARLQIVAGQSLYQEPIPERRTWRMEA